MKIEGSNPVPAVAIQKMAKPLEKAEKPFKEPEAEDVQEASSSETPEKMRGVIRLLMEGHFKGVADVRLRINFADEIAAIENANLQTVARSGVETFGQSMEPALQELEDSGLLSEEQLGAVETYRQSLGVPENSTQSRGVIDASGLLENLQTNFDDLMALLNPPPAEPQPAAEPPAEEPAASVEEEIILPAEGEPIPEEEPVEPIVEPQAELPADSLADLLVVLTETFQTALDTLQEQLNTTSVFPEISEPSGNGKAYAKFMAMYEAMNAPAELQPAEEEVPAEAIEEPAPPEGEPFVF